MESSSVTGRLDKMMNSKIIFYGMGMWAGWFSLGRVSESGSQSAVAYIWAMREGGAPVLPRDNAKRGTWGSVARRMVYLLARNLLKPMRTPTHTGACATFHRGRWWGLLRARLLRLGRRRLCRHTTFRIRRRERRGFWPSCCSGRCRRVGCRRVRVPPGGWW